MGERPVTVLSEGPASIPDWMVPLLAIRCVGCRSRVKRPFGAACQRRARGTPMVFGARITDVATKSVVRTCPKYPSPQVLVPLRRYAGWAVKEATS